MAALPLFFTRFKIHLLLKDILKNSIDWQGKGIPSNKKDGLRAAVLPGKLPKFDRFQGNFCAAAM